jgi:DNA-binding MarR family transcriptional regulator
MHDHDPSMTSRIDLCNCFAARQAARAITRTYERHLAPSGLTSSQFTLLVLLEDRPGIGMRELSEDMVMDRTSLVRALKPLQRDGLVAVAPSVDDSRQNVYLLTPAGHAKTAQAGELWATAQAEYEATFGSATATATRETMHRIGQMA